MDSNHVSLFPDNTTSNELSSTTGTLPSQTIRELIKSGRISSAVEISDEQIQPASIDLRLGPVAYRVRASFLPGQHSTVDRKIKDLQIVEDDLSKPTGVEKGGVLLVPPMIHRSLPSETL